MKRYFFKIIMHPGTITYLEAPSFRAVLDRLGDESDVSSITRQGCAHASESIVGTDVAAYPGATSVTRWKCNDCGEVYTK